MRSTRLVLCFLTTIALAGCGGPSGSAPALGSEFLYQVSFVNDIQASKLDSGTGVLGPPTDAALNLPIESTGLHPVVTPSNEFLYVEGFDQSYFANAIYCFSVNGTNGQLTSLATSPFFVSELPNPNGMAMDGKGRFFYLSDFGDSFSASGQPTNSIRAYSIDPTTGALQNGPIFTSTSTYWLSAQAIDPTNSYLYAATVLPGTGSLDISVYSINPSTQALTEIPGSPFLVANTDPDQEYNLSLFTTPAGNFVYAVVINNYGNSEVIAFSADSGTGKLTLVPGSQFAIGNVSSAMLHPSGQFLFTTTPGSGITVFPVDTANGTIAATPASSVSIAGYFGQTLIDPSGQVLLFNDSYSTASSFAIDVSTGSLTPVAGSPYSVGPGWKTAIIVKAP